MTPTQRTLAHARELGYACQVVERWCQYSRRRIDLFGGIDILACREGNGILGIQACAAASHAARATKLRALLDDGDSPLAAFKAAGAKVEIWSWGLRGARGKRKKYELRREELTDERGTA